MGGCYGDGKYYPASKVVWSEIELAAAIEKGSPFGHMWMQDDMRELAPQHGMEKFDWEPVLSSKQVTDSYKKMLDEIDESTKRRRETTITETKHSEYTAKFEEYTLRKLFFYQNGSLGIARFLVEKDGKVIDGCEHTCWLTSPYEHKLHILDLADRFFQYYLLRLKGLYNYRTIELKDKKGKDIRKYKYAILDKPKEGDSWTKGGKCSSTVLRSLVSGRFDAVA